MGFVFVMALGLYVLISIAVVAGAVKYAKKHNKSVERWGWGATFGMYLLVFWDWIPTVVTHKHYCSTEAGFWVYKMPKQWESENSGVLESLVANKGAPSARVGDMQNYVDTYFLNQRIHWLVKHSGPFLINLWKHEQEVVDSKTNEVLARYVDFSTSQERQQSGWSGWKFWLYSGLIGDRYCSGGSTNKEKLRMFRNHFMGNEK